MIYNGCRSDMSAHTRFSMLFLLSIPLLVVLNVWMLNATRRVWNRRQPLFCLNIVKRLLFMFFFLTTTYSFSRQVHVRWLPNLTLGTKINYSCTLFISLISIQWIFNSTMVYFSALLHIVYFCFLSYIISHWTIEIWKQKTSPNWTK